MTTETIASLMAWVVAFTGYAEPDRLPVIEYVPIEFIQSKLCPGLNDICVARTKHFRGMYDDNLRGILFINEDYRSDKPSITLKSIVVHEMVHYLQDLRGHWSPNKIARYSKTQICQARRARQMEAYMIQDLYMEKIHGRRYGVRTYKTCGDLNH